jgi:hypothetical protein
MILQKYGSKVITAIEAIKELKLYDINNKFLQPKIDDYYQNIISKNKSKRKAKIIEEVIPKVDVEVVIEDDKDMTISENE